MIHVLYVSFLDK